MVDTDSTTPRYSRRQVRMIKEIQRIASNLGVDRLSQREFDQHHSLGGVTTAGDLALPGARTLEGMNLAVDAAKKKLVAAGPLPAA